MRAPEPPAVPAVPVPATPSARLRALVVDDEESVLRLQRLFLKRMGVEASVVTTGEDAIRHLQHHGVDVIISDVRMPGVNGIQLYAWVGEHHPDLLTRFLFVSGDLVDSDARALAGIQDVAFIAKPFTFEEYQRVVCRVIDRGGRHA
jgi:DNA-binding NtrC family response regulator